MVLGAFYRSRSHAARLAFGLRTFSLWTTVPMTAVLETRAVSISFGGVRAVQEVNLRYQPERRSWVRTAPENDILQFDEVSSASLAGVCPRRHHGLPAVAAFAARLAHVPIPHFLALTVWENVLIAVSGVAGFGPRGFAGRRRRETGRHIDALLDHWALAEHRSTPADALIRAQRLLEIALAFATRPRVVMLTSRRRTFRRERAMVTGRLQALSRDVTLILTDHD